MNANARAKKARNDTENNYSDLVRQKQVLLAGVLRITRGKPSIEKTTTFNIHLLFRNHLTFNWFRRRYLPASPPPHPSPSPRAHARHMLGAPCCRSVIGHWP